MAESNTSASRNSDFDANSQPDFHILICLIDIWTPADRNKPNGPALNDNHKYICEVESVEISESWKKLISTASVRFPRGTVIRETIQGWTKDQADQYKNVTATVEACGVVEENRVGTSVATTNSFSVEDRIRIYLGYTTDPKVAELAKVGSSEKTVYNDSSTRQEYLDNFQKVAFESNGEKKVLGGSSRYMGLMFDGYITQISLDTPIELECENLASRLKTITCPNQEVKSGKINDVLGSESGFKLLEKTGLVLHPDTEALNINVGSIPLNNEYTVADILTTWAKFGLFSYVTTDNDGNPAIQIARAYFSNPGNDSILQAKTTPVPIDIHFDYHVAKNGLGLTSTDKKFLVVEAQGIDKDDKFIHVTVARNDSFDPNQPESESNARYRGFNESTLSKKAIQAGKRYVTDSPKEKLNTKLYTKIAFISKAKPVEMKKLIEEAWQYLEGYNMTGIEGDLTLFGDFCIRTAQQVNLIDNRYSGKNGRYLVDEVHTTFGVNGFRQRITIPYCIKREGNEDNG